MQMRYAPEKLYANKVCCEILQVVRISRSGYPTRVTHQEFAERYGILSKFDISQDPLSASVSVLQQFGIQPEMNLTQRQRELIEEFSKEEHNKDDKIDEKRNATGKMARLKQTQRKRVGSVPRLPVDVVAVIAAEVDLLVDQAFYFWEPNIV
ncbi:hypothetical protein AgCh_033628 [Apium graveolens]